MKLLPKQITMKKVKQSKKILSNHIRHLAPLNDSEIEFLTKIITLFNKNVTKGDLINFAFDGVTSGIDTAMPLGTRKYFNDSGIKFNEFFNVMSCQEDYFGEYVNIADIILNKIIVNMNDNK